MTTKGFNFVCEDKVVWDFFSRKTMNKRELNLYFAEISITED